jgi:hypothetical protein
MPLLSSFYGILIYIYSEINERHNLPHFHARYAEHRAVYDLEGNCLSGGLPKKQNNLIIAWFELHKEELEAAWIAWNEDGVAIKIEGLR